MKYKTPYKDLLPPLSTVELEALRASIELEGVRDPIVVDELGQVLDGHHRLLIAPDAPCRVISGLTDAEKRAYVYQSNLARRNLSLEQKQEMAKGMKKTALALKREGKTQAQIAAKLGVSQKTISQWLTGESDTSIIPGYNACIPDCRVKIPPEHEPIIRQRAAAGESQAQIAADYGVSQQRISQIIHSDLRLEQRCRQAEEREQTQKNTLDTSGLTGLYRAIVIDPPWPVQKILRDVRPHQDVFDYPTMTLEEIAKLPIPALAHPDGCHIYLWATHKYIPAAFDLFEKWGVRYECLMTWHKNVGPTPFSWMYDTEHVLFGRIGTLKLLKVGLRLCFEAPVRGHSVKPAIFYKRVMEASPPPRLELFARQKRDGFEVWGNEI